MIVRNEQRFIEQCLSSIKDFVDEIVVVDTGSEDSTPEIARRFGATVYHFPWTGNFSAARNHSIAQAQRSWILVLDADELLAERDARRLRELTAAGKSDGFKLIQRTYLQNANFVCASPNPRDYEEGRAYSDCVDVPVIRLFRTDSRIRYSGRVHELVEPAFVSSAGLVCEDSGLVIHHFGKVGDPANLERKKQVYLDLGRRKAMEEPENALAQFELGVQLYELERFPECLPFFNAAVKLNPAFDMALLYIAKALHATGEMEEAARYFQKCRKHSPKSDKVLFDYANFARDRGNAGIALKLYQEALAANPRHALALFNMGILRVRTGDAPGGLNLIEKAIRLNPDNAQFHENLGRLYLAGQDLERAIPLIERYVERFPRAAGCLAVLAETCFRSGDFERAEELADRAIAAGPPDVGILLTRGNANFSLRRLGEAEESYRSVLLLDPTNVGGMMNLAAIAEIRGDHDEARTWYLRILGAHPSQVHAMKKLAAAQTRNGIDEESLGALDRACRADLADPECLMLVGSLLERAGRIERAAELYESAARGKPEWSGAIQRKVQQMQLTASKGGTPDVSVSL